MKFCIRCGCSEAEARQQTCLGGVPYHALRSTEERTASSAKHKERVYG